MAKNEKPDIEMTTTITFEGGEPAAEWVDIDELVEWENNPRVNDHAVADVATSIKRFGFASPIIARRADREIIAGHTRLKAARELGLKKVPVRWMDLDPADAHLLALADNKIAEVADWDGDALASLMQGFNDEALDLTGLGWSGDELSEMLALGTGGGSGGEGDLPTVPDDLPTVPDDPLSIPGEVYALGRHRLICGDSTNPKHISRLFLAQELATLVHADPPYGMGKEGVTNDNLRGANLDAFQDAWWVAWRPHLANNGSAYIWGNAEGLWRWWFSSLATSEPEINVRNEVVWYKGVASAGGVGLEGSEGMRGFPSSTERCLVVMFRQQGAPNSDEFPEGFEPLRAYLDGERERMSWGPGDTKRITGVGMHPRWFSKSQWRMPSRERYEMLQAAAAGAAFLRPFDELRGDRDERGFFDSTASPCSDVWDFPRVLGEERQGHPTPKPVAMVERAVVSSSKRGDIIAVPFGGSCPDIIACERTGRIARIAELEPGWCDVIRRRWTRYASDNGLEPGDGALDG